ncbi:MAG: diacylglycerol kinase [Gammaproteobacteria bacterium]|nr:diacylglycerol kinase [Gammaproteobacteria bacterium]MDH3767741.1 diacylglycerol kinase [Gammaproteobacteria bacterium]
MNTRAGAEFSESPDRQQRSGLARIFRATGYSLSGLRAAFRTETAFRQELGFAVLLVPLAFFAGETLVQTALLLATLFLVLIVELINSAIETIVDRIGLEENELSGRAKDMGSAAVMLSLILVVTVWSLVLYTRFFG